MQGPRWCFTLNNYSAEDEEVVKAIDNKYIVYGRETSDSGTPHLQGFIVFRSTKRLAAVKKLLPTAHWEVAKGTSKQASDYCKKDTDYYESGSFPDKSGCRSDLDNFCSTVKSGVIDKKRLRDEFRCVYSKYPRFCDDFISDHVPRPDIPSFPYRPWQQTLYDDLQKDPDDRTIIFIVDYEGNQGKSWFSKHYGMLHPSDTFTLRPTKHADMAYALPDSLRVLFLDCTRQQVEHLPYAFLEAVKDGMVFSPKYESRVKYYSNVHIVVLMNEDPETKYLSQDRLDIRHLNS